MSKSVTFGQFKLMGFLGLLVGAVIALGVPWLVFSFGPDAGVDNEDITFLSGAGIIGGAVVATTAALFSLVIPSTTQAHGPRNAAKPESDR